MLKQVFNTNYDDIYYHGIRLGVRIEEVLMGIHGRCLRIHGSDLIAPYLALLNITAGLNGYIMDKTHAVACGGIRKTFMGDAITYSEEGPNMKVYTVSLEVTHLNPVTDECGHYGPGEAFNTHADCIEDTINRRMLAALGWKFMSCSHCQELCQQASWLLIGSTRVINQSEEARSSSLHNSLDND